jgi:hypothetical protein
MVRKHSSEAFYAPDGPLEAAVFSVLVERMKAGRERADKEGGLTRDGYTTEFYLSNSLNQNIS